MACIILHDGKGPTITPESARRLPARKAEPLLEQVLPFVDDATRKAVLKRLVPCSPGEYLAGLMEAVGKDAPDLMVS